MRFDFRARCTIKLRSMLTPNDVNVIALELLIVTNQNELFLLGLSDKQPIKRVGMMTR